MKRTIFASFLSFLLILSSFVVAFADITSPNPYVTYEGEKGSQLWSAKTPTISNSYLISYDSLNLIYADLVQQGWPCRLTSILISGTSYFYILGTGKVTVQSDLGTVGHDTVSYDITGRCFAIASGSSTLVDHPVIARSPDSDTYGGTHWILQKLNVILSSIDAISSDVSTISSRMSTLLGYVDGIEGYIDGVEAYLANHAATLSSISSSVSDLKSSVPFVSGYSSFTDGTAYPIYNMRPSQADEYVTFINTHYAGKEVNYLDRDQDNTAVGTRVLLNAYVDQWHNLRAYVLNPNGSTANLFLMSPNHRFLCELSHYVSTAAIFGAIDGIETTLTDINTAISNINSISNNNNTHNTNVILKFDSLISATADIDANLDSLVGNVDITLGSIVDSMNLGFDDVVGAINGLPASNVSGLIPYVDQLEGYTDGIEGLITTGNTNLSTLISSNNDIVDGIIAIQEWLEGRDVLDYEVIRDLIDTWGSSLTYTVLNSDNIIGLFYKAFGDVPSSVDWSRAKNYFDSFYAGGS